LARNVNFPNSIFSLNYSEIASPNNIIIYDALWNNFSDSSTAVLMSAQIGTENASPRFRIYANDLELINSYTFQSPDSVYVRMTTMKNHPQGGYIVAGLDSYYLSNGPGVDRIDSHLWKFDQGGDLLWERSGGLDWFGEPSNVMLNESNEIVLVGNCLIPGGGGGGTNYDIAITKLDSLGNVIVIDTWGSLNLDGTARGIQLSSNSAILSYTQTTSVYPELLPYHYYRQVHIELLNLETLERTPVSLFPDTYLNLTLIDFVKTTTGYLISAEGLYTPASSSLVSYLFWLDEQGQLTHQRMYHMDSPSEVAENSLSLLKQISEHDNGWFSACGQAAGPQGSRSWVIHLDPCGDIVYSGCALGIDDLTDTQAPKAYPNPVAQQGTLHLEGEWTKSTLIRFYTLHGQLAFEYTVPFDTNMLAIPLPHLATGIYAIRSPHSAFRVVVE
jgi:hypothetical protein